MAKESVSLDSIPISLEKLKNAQNSRSELYTNSYRLKVDVIIVH